MMHSPLLCIPVLYSRDVVHGWNEHILKNNSEDLLKAT